MAYMVIFRSAEGKAGYHQAETLGDAVKFVERVRNEEQTEQARIFRMEEVAFEFKPYYRVELATGDSPAGGDTPAPDAAPGAPAEPAGAEAGAADVLDPAPEPVESNGRRVLFGR